MKFRLLICFLIGILVLALGVFYVWPSDDAVITQEPIKQEIRRKSKKIKDVKTVARVRARKPAKKRRITEMDTMLPKDRQLCVNIQSALDADNLEALRKLLDSVRNSKDPEVRKAMVDALGWFGKVAIGEMAGFLLDSNGDVREAAGNNWQMAISDIEDEKVKAGLTEETLLTVTDEGLTDMIASEYNGMDEKVAVESIIRVIAGGTLNGVKAAKEAYQFVTGEEYVSAAEARAWVRENYHPEK